MRRTSLPLLLLVLCSPPAFAVNGASRCVGGDAALGNGFAVRIPPGFCEYHFDGPDFVTGRVVRRHSSESLVEFYAGFAGFDLEQITHDPAEVCRGAIVETSTNVAFAYAGT